MTLTEKILARAGGKAGVKAGDNVWVNADGLLTHDVCGPRTIGRVKADVADDVEDDVLGHDALGELAFETKAHGLGNLQK